MLDGVSLDQLRAFIAAVDEGSFLRLAHAGLQRAQSVVSELVSNLEADSGWFFSIVPSATQSSRPPASYWLPMRAVSWPTSVCSRPAPKGFPVASSRNSRQSWTCFFRSSDC